MGHNTCAGITLPPKFVVFEVRPLVSHNEDLNSPKQRGQSTATHQHLPPSTSGERGLPAHQRPLGPVETASRDDYVSCIIPSGDPNPFGSWS